jgi:hypothetical protein
MAEAMEIKVTRDGKLFAVHYPPDSEFGPLVKNSAQALAHLSFMAQFCRDWPEIQEATRYDPGLNYRTGKPDVPEHGLAGWEIAALEKLAVTEKS